MIYCEVVCFIHHFSCEVVLVLVISVSFLRNSVYILFTSIATATALCYHVKARRKLLKFEKGRKEHESAQSKTVRWDKVGLWYWTIGFRSCL